VPVQNLIRLAHAGRQKRGARQRLNIIRANSRYETKAASTSTRFPAASDVGLSRIEALFLLDVAAVDRRGRSAPRNMVWQDWNRLRAPEPEVVARFVLRRFLNG